MMISLVSVILERTSSILSSMVSSRLSLQPLIINWGYQYLWSLIWSFQLQEWMWVWFCLFTLLTEIEVPANWTFVADTNYRIFFTSITSDIPMNCKLSLFWYLHWNIVLLENLSNLNNNLWYCIAYRVINLSLKLMLMLMSLELLETLERTLFAILLVFSCLLKSFIFLCKFWDWQDILSDFPDFSLDQHLEFDPSLDISTALKSFEFCGNVIMAQWLEWLFGIRLQLKLFLLLSELLPVVEMVKLISLFNRQGIS